MKAVRKTAAMRYTQSAPETTGAGFGDLLCSLAQRSRAVTRHAAFVFAFAFARRLWVGVGGETFGSAGIQRRRFANPAHCPPTPFGDGTRVSILVSGGRPMRPNAPARPEQLQSSLEIIRTALRAAALAPTDQVALDVTGDALRRLAEIARAEVAHG